MSGNDRYGTWRHKSHAQTTSPPRPLSNSNSICFHELLFFVLRLDLAPPPSTFYGATSTGPCHWRLWGFFMIWISPCYLYLWMYSRVKKVDVVIVLFLLGFLIYKRCFFLDWVAFIVKDVIYEWRDLKLEIHSICSK